MKRLGISIAIILMCFSGAHAQLLKSYGFKTGVVIANQDFEYGLYAKVGSVVHTKNIMGFDFGVFMEWFNFPFFSALTEAHYVQKGMIDEVPRFNEYGEPISPMRLDNRVDYLSVPILAKIAVKTKSLTPYLVIGPRFDLFIGYSSEIGEIIYNQFKDIDVGGDIGIGIESKTEPLKMLLEFRYSPSFTNAFKNDVLEGVSSVKNNSYEILLGLRL